MNAVTNHHDVFNPSGTLAGSLFRNDFSSKNALEKLAEAQDVEEAKRKKTVEEAAELDKLRSRVPVLEAQIKALQTENSTLETAKTTAQTQKTSLEAQIIQQKTAYANLELQIATTKRQLLQFGQDSDLMKGRLNQSDSQTNLDHAYHDKVVRLTLACAPHTGLDFGANGGGYAHGWESGPDFAWQRLRLRRVDNSSAWTITYADQEWYLSLGPKSQIEVQKGRRLDGNKSKQEWYIGLHSSKKGYIIQSVPSGNLEVVSPREVKNGKELRSGNRGCPGDGQIWQITLA
ncbi:hypothetical protein HJFPF1_05427 [Paramyrothecium foliicola]|nr:hypothetical protein HJFPF1_05427 [Paramyrothecium foliicola]